MPLIGIAIYLVIDFAVYFFHPMSEQWMGLYVDGLIVCACALAASMFLRVVFLFDAGDRARRYWLLLSIALILTCAGKLIFLVYEHALGMIDPFPCIGDAFILTGDCFFLVGVWLFLRDCVALPTTPAYSGEAIVILAGFFLMLVAAVLVVMPSLSMHGDTMGVRLLTTTYVILDVLLFTLTLRLALLFLYSGRAPIAYPWLIFTGVFAFMSLADCFRGFLEILDRYHPYHWINIVWVLGYLLISHAGLAQARLMRSIEKNGGRWPEKANDAPHSPLHPLIDVQ